MQTVLVTGATGFLGSYLMHALLDEGFNVVILKRSTSDVWRIADVLESIHSYDVDTQTVDQAFQEHDVDIVIHTACNYGRNGESIKQIVDTNVLFGLEILECSLKYNIQTFINTDTMLPEDLNVYTRSKKQFVEWLQIVSENLQIVNMKLEHMYGPKDGTTKFVPWVLSQFAENVDQIKLTKGEQKRDFIFIKDVVTAYLTVIKNRRQLAGFTEFNVGTGKSIPLKDFVKKMKETFEKENRHIKTMLNFGAVPYREKEVMSVKVKNEGLINLGWEPKFDICEGLKKLIQI